MVTESMAGARSVTLGAWVGVGSRDEPHDLSGASHFLEHLLFKGTERRSARQIAETVEAVGGEMNAFTAKERTAYHLRLPGEELSFGLDLLGDVLSGPALRPDEVDAERQVILEELLQSADEPDDRVHTLCYEALFPEHPLGWEVLGSTDTIEAMGRDDIADFFGTWYRPANLVVAAAGDLDHDTVVAAVESGFTGSAPGLTPTRSGPTSPAAPLAVLTRSTEQTHLAVGWRAMSLDDPDRYALAVLNQVFGGGLSSRLFQEIREARGLAYSVGSYTALYADTGALVAYAGTSPVRLAEVRGLVEEGAAALLADGVTDEELAVAVGYLRGSTVLGLEDTGSRMARIGASVVARGEVTPLDQHLAQLSTVTPDHLAQVAYRVLSSEPTVAVVGPVREADLA